MVFTFLENALNLSTFLMTEFPFQNSETKGVEKIMIWFIKTQSENTKMTWNISLYIVCMICNFLKFDSFTVLWIISIK